MAQYFTDFSEYDVGDQPGDGMDDWAEPYTDAEWEIQEQDDENVLTHLDNSTDDSVVYPTEFDEHSDAEIYMKSDTVFDNVGYASTNIQDNETSFYTAGLDVTVDKVFGPDSVGFELSLVDDGGVTEFGLSDTDEQPSPLFTRLDREGNSLDAEFWLEDDEGNPDVAINTTDSTFTSGFSGIGSYSLDEHSIFEVGIGTEDDEAPTEPITDDSPEAPTDLSATLSE